MFIWISSWAAALSSAATLGTLITGVLLFTVGNGFGRVNDLFIVFQVLLMIPLVFLFNQILTPPALPPA